jgi:hypothetical protein
MRSFMRFLRPTSFVVALGVASLSLPQIARAQSGGSGASPAPTAAAKKQGETHFRQGVKLYQEGDFNGALVEFRKSYEAVPNAGVLYNVGQSQYQLNDYAGALGTFESYLAKGGTSVPKARRTEVEREIQTLKERTAHLHITSNQDGAEVTIDGEVVGVTPLATDPVVSIGKRTIHVAKSGFTAADKKVEVAGGEVLPISLDLTEIVVKEDPPPPPPPKAPPPPPPARSVPIVPWVVTGVLAAGTAVTGVLALDASGRLKSLRAEPNPSASDLSSRSDAAKTWALTSDILLAGTAVAAGVAIYLTVRTPGSAKATGTLRIVPGGLLFGGAF